MRILLFSLLIALLLLVGHSTSARSGPFTPPSHTNAHLQNGTLTGSVAHQDNDQLSVPPLGITHLLARARTPSAPPLPRGATVALAGGLTAFLLFSCCYCHGTLRRGTTRRTLFPLRIPLRL